MQEEREIEQLLAALQETPASLRKKKEEAVHLHIVPEDYTGPHVFSQDNISMSFVTEVTSHHA